MEQGRSITAEKIEEHFTECETAKKDWEEGPWQNEPHRVEFEHAGLRCLVSRNSRMGNWCGYVGVPPKHPYFGKDYNDVDPDVHGGLTYANECAGNICHVSENENLYWFGFDCAHCYDLVPGMRATLRKAMFPETRDEAEKNDVYRDVEYVTAETKKLAEQLAKAAA